MTRHSVCMGALWPPLCRRRIQSVLLVASLPIASDSEAQFSTPERNLHPMSRLGSVDSAGARRTLAARGGMVEPGTVLVIGHPRRLLCDYRMRQ